MRKKLILIGVLATLIIAGYLLWLDATIWSIHRYPVKSYVVQNEQLPSTFANVRIVFISDLHAFAEGRTDDFEAVLTKVNALAPDLVIFGGDLVDESAPTLSEDQLNELSNFLKLMDAPLGKFAVLGIQDGAQESVLTSLYTQSDVELLDQKVVEIYNGSGKSIRLAGIRPDLSQLDLSFLGTTSESFTVLVSALPDVADRLGETDADLILSGSTHGGQVRLPLISPLFTSGEMNYVSGKHLIGDSTLIVSKGLGTTRFHARFLADPDILSIRLIP